MIGLSVLDFLRIAPYANLWEWHVTLYPLLSKR